MSQVKVHVNQLHQTLRQYHAEAMPEYFTDKAHVYFSRPTQRYITVARKGDTAILTFTAECPCSDVLNGKMPKPDKAAKL